MHNASTVTSACSKGLNSQTKASASEGLFDTGYRDCRNKVSAEQSDQSTEQCDTTPTVNGDLGQACSLGTSICQAKRDVLAHYVYLEGPGRLQR